MSPQALPHLFQEDLYSFRSQLIVVLSKNWESYKEEEQMLLRKILSSVKVDINAVLIIAQPVIDLKVLQTYTPSRVLVFGSTPNEELPSYQATSAQGFTVIRADDLNELDDQRKKNLWLALRQMFGV